MPSNGTVKSTEHPVECSRNPVMGGAGPQLPSRSAAVATNVPPLTIKKIASSAGSGETRERRSRLLPSANLRSGDRQHELQSLDRARTYSPGGVGGILHQRVGCRLDTDLPGSAPEGEYLERESEGLSDNLPPPRIKVADTKRLDKRDQQCRILTLNHRPASGAIHNRCVNPNHPSSR